jgi:hypothetical protein
VIPLNADAVNTILIVSNFNLNCEVATRGQRLLDVLNDGNTRYLQIRGGQISGGSGQQAVLEIGETLVVKDNLEMALPVQTGAQGARNLFYATLERNTAKVVMTLPTAVVQGEIHVKAARDAQTFLSIEAGNFIPVTNATVHHLSSDGEPAEKIVALVNRTYISSLAFDN